MNLKTLLFLSALAFAAQAATPPCILGGPTAVNLKRELAEGEHFAKTDRITTPRLKSRVLDKAGKPTDKFTAGNCVLPEGTEVAADDKTGMMLWVKSCGNDEVNRNIPVSPPAEAEAPEPQKGDKGDTGDAGPRGKRGPQGLPGAPGPSSGIKSVDQDVTVAVTEGVAAPERTESRTAEDGKVTQHVRVLIPASVLRPPVKEKEKVPRFCHSTGCKVALAVIGAGVVGGAAYWGAHRGANSNPNIDPRTGLPWPPTLPK